MLCMHLQTVYSPSQCAALTAMAASITAIVLVIIMITRSGDDDFNFTPLFYRDGSMWSGVYDRYGYIL